MIRSRAAPVGLALLLSGCSLHSHRIEISKTVPPISEAQLDEKAIEHCAAVRPGGELPEWKFYTDGCTGWPDKRWLSCCVEHDISYWCGGSKQLRRAADRELRRCVRSVSNKANSTVMWSTVRLLGARWIPAWWRWGSGDPWPATRP